MIVNTQGSEIAILQGAQQTLQGVSLLYLELPILRYNKGAPTFTEYIEYLSSISFLPVALFEIHSLNGALVQVDILFMSQELHSKVYGCKNLEITLRLI